MLIKALGPIEIELGKGRSINLADGELADIPGGLAQRAIHQGAASAAQLEQPASAEPPKKRKTGRRAAADPDETHDLPPELRKPEGEED